MSAPTPKPPGWVTCPRCNGVTDACALCGGAGGWPTFGEHAVNADRNWSTAVERHWRAATASAVERAEALEAERAEAELASAQAREAERRAEPVRRAVHRAHEQGLRLAVLAIVERLGAVRYSLLAEAIGALHTGQLKATVLALAELKALCLDEPFAKDPLITFHPEEETGAEHSPESS
jgi:hypothetical protein